MTDFDEHIITLDKSISESVHRAKQQMRINARTQELLRDDGATYDHCRDKAREKAASEVLGVLANQ